MPSPALMTFDSMRSARKCAAPDAPWRITTMSIRIASRFRAVSTSVSPFDTLEPDDGTLTVSADSRFSANSKEMRVRVDASKNRLTIVVPRSAGTFLIVRSLISLNGSAVSRMSRICSRAQLLEPQQVLARARGRVTSASSRHDDHGVLAIELRDQHVDALGRGDVDRLADDVGVDRQLAAAAIHEDRERDARGPAEVRELVERRANRAARVEHIVDDHDALAVEVPAEGASSRRPDAARRSAGRRDRA